MCDLENMAHWFHRNPLKATEYAKWEMKSTIANDTAAKICRLF